MEQLVNCIEEQEVKIIKHIDEDRYVDEEVVEGETDIAKEEPEKKYRLSGPDFRKKEVKVAENLSVMKFQKTGDLKVLEELYLNRVPTLNYWARKNRHLDGNSFNDIKSELTRIFLKAVKQYKVTRATKVDGKRKTAKTDFNT